MPKLIILQGIPCSGKNYWIMTESWRQLTDDIFRIVSRDDIRMWMFKLSKYNDYEFSKENEIAVSEQEEKELITYIQLGRNILLNNTNLKPKYYQKWVDTAKEYRYEIEYKKFPIHLWKAQWRNIIRWMKTGKYIPFKVMKSMQKNYKKLK